MARYVALWHGGMSYSPGQWALDAEVINGGLNDARAIMWARHLGGRHQPPTQVCEWNEDGTARPGVLNDPMLTPGTDDGASMLLVPLTQARLRDLETEGAYACSHRVEITPRGRVRLVKL